MQIDAVIQAARKRIAELMVERRQIDDEMEFYVRDPSKAPNALRRRLEDNQQSVSVQNRFISEQDEEKKRVHARFDEERSRLTPLWAATGAQGERPALSRSRWRLAGPKAAPLSRAELRLQQRIDLRRVGLALAGLHDLADQRIEGLVLAGAVLVDVLLVLRQHLVDDLFERAGVAHLLEALGLDERVDAIRRRQSAAGRLHSASNTWRAALFEMVPSAMRAISCASCGGADRRRSMPISLRVQPAGDLARDPVARQLGRRAGRHRPSK